MTCQQLIELVTAYLEDALAPAVRAAFDHHVELCPGCAVYMDQIRQTIRLLGGLPQPPLPATRREALLQRFREVQQGTS
jgi:anti-sigma factor RsiW